MLLLGSTTFFVFGIVLILLGATQAELARDLGLDLSATGLLGSVLALGLGIGVLIAGPLSDHWPRKPVFVGASVLTAVALLAVNRVHGYGALVGLLLVIGVGCGAYDTIINAAVVERYAARASSALALVHASATLGACIGPGLIQLMGRAGHWSDAFHALGYAHCGLIAWGVSADWSRAPSVSGELDVAPHSRRWLTSPALFALCVIGFAYVGAESGLTLFAIPWALARAESERAGQLCISAFWFGLALGRLMLAARTPRRGLLWLSASGWLGALILTVANALPIGPLAAATALAGVALGPVYPLMIAQAAQRFRRATGTAVGVVAGAGAAGGFAVPWLVGTLGDAQGVRAGIALLTGHVLLIAAAAVVRTQLKPRVRPRTRTRVASA